MSLYNSRNMPGRIFEQLQPSKRSKQDRKIDFHPAGNQQLSPVAPAELWKNTRPVGPGLINVGNTCFLNAVLQCITYAPCLSSEFLRRTHRSSCRKKNACTYCLMESHVNRCLNPKFDGVSAFKPMPIVSNLKRIAQSLRIGRQEDAHEFLRFLVEAMHQGASGNEKGISPIYNAMKGTLRSRIVCSDCRIPSDCIDPFLDLSLEIKNSKSIKQALDRFTAPEFLSQSNRYNCSNCKELRNAKKQITFKSAPKTLSIHLKRFGFINKFGAKLAHHVIFEDVLDLSSFMIETGSVEMYDLTGVLVHSGQSCSSGHYYAFVKAPNGSWYCADDTTVSKVSLKEVLSQKAYILFYNKEEITKLPVFKPPSTPIQEEVVLQPPVASSLKANPVDALDQKVRKFASKGIISKLNKWLLKEMLGSSKHLRATDFAKVDKNDSVIPKRDIPKSNNPNLINQVKSASKSVSNMDALLPSSITTWPHISTSDLVFKRGQFAESLWGDKKQKRASREDMLYDEPRRKVVLFSL